MSPVKENSHLYIPIAQRPLSLNAWLIRVVKLRFGVSSHRCGQFRIVAVANVSFELIVPTTPISATIMNL